MPHPTELPVEELLAQCSFERTRRQGPGGQHRNKTETAVVVTHVPTGVRGEASERRSQAQNRAVAIHRLRVRLAVEVRDADRAVPSALWAARSGGGRLAVSDSHADFPSLLAEALDVLARNGVRGGGVGGGAGRQLVAACEARGEGGHGLGTGEPRAWAARLEPDQGGPVSGEPVGGLVGL